MVKILLRRVDVKPDKPANNSQAPLTFAALHGQEEVVVEILLAQDNVNPDRPDNDRQTPLW